MNELLRVLAATYFLGMCGSGLWFGLNIAQSFRAGVIPHRDSARDEFAFWGTLALMTLLWPGTWVYVWFCMRKERP